MCDLELVTRGRESLTLCDRSSPRWVKFGETTHMSIGVLRGDTWDLMFQEL